MKAPATAMIIPVRNAANVAKANTSVSAKQKDCNGHLLLWQSMSFVEIMDRRNNRNKKQ